MIQGILILAHKNTEQLMHLIGYFSTDCYVFIHIDRKSDFYEKYTIDYETFSVIADGHVPSAQLLRATLQIL